MPIEVQWDNDERTIMRVDYPEAWSWEEMYDAQTLGKEMADEIGHPYDVIHDLRKTTHLPPGAFSNLRRIMSRMHPLNRGNVYVGMNPFIRAVWNSFSIVYSTLSRSKKFFFADTPNHARIVLEDAFEVHH